MWNNTCDPIFTSTGETVPHVSSFSFLGVTFSCDLKWNIHFTNVIKKASKRVFIIRNLKRAGCSQPLMERVYVSLIRAVLLYAYPCFCNAPDYLLQRLCRVERRIARIIGEDFTVSPPLLDAANSMCMNLMNSVRQHPEHLLRGLFETSHSRTTRHSKSLRRPFARTKRLSTSFLRFAELWSCSSFLLLLLLLPSTLYCNCSLWCVHRDVKQYKLSILFYSKVINKNCIAYYSFNE